LRIFNMETKCVETWNGTVWISECAPIIIPTTLGGGSLSGRTCFDVVMSNFTGDCGTEANRLPQKADFSQSATNTQVYIFTKAATGTVQNVRYVIQDAEGMLLATQPLSGTLVSGVMTASTDTLTLNFKTDLNATLTGRTRTDAAKVIINIIYNNGLADVNVPLTLSLQDCACCGAMTATGSWLAFMCYNLGVTDQTLDPNTYVEGNADGSGGTLGWLFQWGRKADGHQLRNSATTATRAANTAAAGSSFITTSASPYDWAASQNDSLWGSAKTANDPCPTGYRVPTQAEWSSIFAGGTGAGTISGASTLATANTWTWTGNGYKVGSALFLPAAGYRNSTTGALRSVGTTGYYWSSTPTSTYSYYLLFDSGTVSPGHGDANLRAYGFSVRCVAE